MPKNSLFVVIEGLDGSGKSTAAKLVSQKLSEKVKTIHTFEPNDSLCAGEYLRQVLRKEIGQYSLRILALGFAANRLDHCVRVINPFLTENEPGIVICDRYYLSSLVYQSEEEFPMEAVMQLNEKTRKPDLILFLNVSEKVCYERLKNRNEPEELFEKNFAKTKGKYEKAIQFLREKRQENIVEINGNGTLEQVTDSMLTEIIKVAPFINGKS